MKEYAHDKLFSSAAFENSPLRTYSQSQVGLSPRDRANSFHDIREREEAGPGGRGQVRPRTRHQTLPYGVGSTELTAAKFDMDMKNIIRELEDTGFFHQVRILCAELSASAISVPHSHYVSLNAPTRLWTMGLSDRLTLLTDRSTLLP